MRILFVSQYFHPENTPATEIVKGLVKKGHEVTVLTGQPNYGFGRIAEGYENVFEEEVFGAYVIRVKTYPRYNPKGMKDLMKNYLSFYFHSRKKVRRLKGEFDVVYSMSFSPCISVSAANLYAKKHKLKNVIHVPDLWPESPVAIGAVKRGSLFYRILYRWSKSIYKKGAILLLTSPSFKDYFKDVLKLEKKTEYIPLPATIGASDPIEIKWKHDVNIVYSGNIGKLQLVESLVKAMALLDTEKDVCLHVFGSGSSLAECVKFVRENNLEEKVSIYGRVKAAETAPYQEKADALVVSLKSEDSPVSKTIPNKLVTSLYYGRPIIGVISGDGKKELVNAKGSLFPKDESPEAIADCFKKFLELSAEEKKEMGKNNKAYYQKTFAFPRIMDQLEEVLEKFARKS